MKRTVTLGIRMGWGLVIGLGMSLGGGGCFGPAPADSSCPLGAHPCGDGSCFPEAARCDGVMQCASGVDEMECAQGESDGGETDNQMPAPPDDGPDPDADAGTEGPDCAASSVECPDGTCIDSGSVCDGRQDCAGGWDESDCGAGPDCGDDALLCGDGTCVELAAVCDGRWDCPDGDDEDPALCEVDCAYVCEDSALCIGEVDLCDDYIDCPNEDDERDCGSTRCAAGELACTDGTCVGTADICDGYDDCTDGADEQGCALDGGACEAGAFPCPVGDGCITAADQCDGYIDCPFGLEELLCAPGGDDDVFVCLDGGEIPLSWVCDGQYVDCDDGSDEFGC